jgi:hypothetical protein
MHTWFESYAPGFVLLCRHKCRVALESSWNKVGQLPYMATVIQYSTFHGFHMVVDKRGSTSDLFLNSLQVFFAKCGEGIFENFSSVSISGFSEKFNDFHSSVLTFRR